ncbi:MAG: phasin family protein [Woeseiaceae bacterium]|nr:phasin family protein [Woeseiaceae bacterium]
MANKRQTADSNAAFDLVRKTYLAGLGLVAQTRDQFERKFSEFAQDGEQVRRDVEKTVDGLKSRVEARVAAARQRVAADVESTFTRVLRTTPVATTEDIAKLNTKIDKILVRVAR